MKKRLISLSVLFILPFLVSCGESNTENNTPGAGDNTPSTDTTNLEYRQLSQSVNEYYKNADTSSSDALVSSLNSIITANYVKKSYKDAYTIIAEADEDPYNKDNVLCNYTGVSIPKNLDSTKGWNREHTFPKSHGFNADSFAAYSDCHHLMATGNNINSKRGDLDFDEVESHDGTVETDIYGNAWINNTCFEPRDEIKGDVARMLFYMTVRYNDSTLDLDLVDSIPTETSDTSTGKGTLGNLSTLIKWHYQDPVSDKEIKRNEVVYSYQKNRNPFIDHPEWVNVLYDTDYNKEKVTASKVTKVVNDINALPENPTLENEAAVTSIFNAVAQLNSQERLYVNNFYKLTKARQLLTYLKENSSQADFDIVLDFSGTGLASGYAANQTFSVSTHSFTVSEGGVNNAAFVVGTNGKKVSPSDLTTIGLSGTGSYLVANFSIQNAVKMQIDAEKFGGTVSKMYVLSKTDSTYTKLYEGTFTDGKTTIDLNNFSGQFVIAFEGTTPRVAIKTISIQTK